MNRERLPGYQPPTLPEPALDMRDQDPPYEMQERIRPPGGAPNVLLIMIDDMGFGASSAFGGPCRMPTAERLAAGGLRYSRFHTTALCSPTRAALLSGRNHHSVGMGNVAELSTPAPGYNATRPPSKATLAQTLRHNGYATGAFGKMHGTPPWEQTPAGPFDRWPTGEGFDTFYGFLGGEANQFSPTLVDGTTFVDPPATEEDGYHLSEDLADRAGSWIRQVETFDPDRPWFCYLSFGATHAPFHLPRAWRDRNRGEFAHGWDEQRERTLRRQQEIGVVPGDAELAPWAPGVPRWDELDDTQRLVAERLMETYAAFAEHTDAQVGRLVDRLQADGSLDNTLVLYILGDNGASAEGGLEGTFNEHLMFNGLSDSADRIAGRLDEIGGPHSYVHYPVGWALAMDTPYQWSKQVASHYGGTRNGLIVHWPEGITGGGEVRHQWHHVVDVAPTVLEAAGLPEPTSVAGVPQDPIEGTSFLYSLNDADADDEHTTQYFEMFGNRGIYHDGWTAVTKHRTPWVTGQVDLPAFGDDVWELYDTASDWTQAHDIAGDHPEKLAELQSLFDAEARKHNVLPLDDRMVERLNAELAGRRTAPASLTLDRSMQRLREDAVPSTKNRSFWIGATVEVSDAVGDGVLVAQGGRFGGWSLFVHEGAPRFTYNYVGLDEYVVTSTARLAPGRRRVELAFDYDGGGLGKGGSATLLVDGDPVGSGRIERTQPFAYSLDDTLNVGIDRGTPVTETYAGANGNPYADTVVTVTIDAGDDGAATPTGERLRSTLVRH